MVKCDVGTTSTLVIFFFVGLFAGGRLRGGGVETITLTAAVEDGSAPAPSSPPSAANGTTTERVAPLVGTALRDRIGNGYVRDGQRLITPSISLASRTANRVGSSSSGTGNVGGDERGSDEDEGAPAGNRFAGLERYLEKLPLPLDELPREPFVPPTTLAHVMSNVSLQPVLPEVFVPCCAKTGTTFLWGCTSTAFRPSFVCGSNKAADWSVEKCGQKRYVLPGFRVQPTGCRVERKEFFFWGGGKGEDAVHFKNKGLRWLTGMPTPLYYWQRNARACHSQAEVSKLCYENLPDDIPWERVKRPVNMVEIVPPGGRIHPACKKLRLKNRLQPAFRAGGAYSTPASRIQLEVECALPWVDRRVHSGAVNMDFTPNHMADSKTPARLWFHSPAPRQLKFVVTLRNPLKRAYSEWSMFVKWGWERVLNFGQKLDIEVAQLKKCNQTVFDNPSLILTLPHAQFTEYHARCFSGQAMEYVRNSMYIIGFRNMMRVFDASQFLVIWSEVGATPRLPALLLWPRAFRTRHGAQSPLCLRRQSS